MASKQNISSTVTQGGASSGGSTTTEAVRSSFGPNGYRFGSAGWKPAPIPTSTTTDNRDNNDVAMNNIGTQRFLNNIGTQRISYGASSGGSTTTEAIPSSFGPNFTMFGSAGWKPAPIPTSTTTDNSDNNDVAMNNIGTQRFLNNIGTQRISYGASSGGYTTTEAIPSSFGPNFIMFGSAGWKPAPIPTSTTTDNSDNNDVAMNNNNDIDVMDDRWSKGLCDDDDDDDADDAQVGAANTLVTVASPATATVSDTAASSLPVGIILYIILIITMLPAEFLLSIAVIAAAVAMEIQEGSYITY